MVAYNEANRNTILDYQVTITDLKPNDRIVVYGEAGNYSITGFEMTFSFLMDIYP